MRRSPSTKLLSDPIKRSHAIMVGTRILMRPCVVFCCCPPPAVIHRRYPWNGFTVVWRSCGPLPAVSCAYTVLFLLGAELVQKPKAWLARSLARLCGPAQARGSLQAPRSVLLVSGGWPRVTLFPLALAWVHERSTTQVLTL